MALADVGGTRIPDPELAAELCVMREERGLSREQLAQRSGISSESLARIETGQVAPAFEVIRRLVGAVGVGLVEVGPAAELEGFAGSGLHGGGRRRHEPRRRGIPRR